MNQTLFTTPSQEAGTSYLPIRWEGLDKLNLNHPIAVNFMAILHALCDGLEAWVGTVRVSSKKDCLLRCDIYGKARSTGHYGTRLLGVFYKHVQAGDSEEFWCSINKELPRPEGLVSTGALSWDQPPYSGNQNQRFLVNEAAVPALRKHLQAGPMRKGKGAVITIVSPVIR